VSALSSIPWSNHNVKSTSEFKRLSLFVIVGGVNTALTYALYAGLVWVGYHYLLALTIEYAIGILAGFIANRQWTFADRDRKGPALLRYMATYCGVYVLNAVLLTFFVECADLHTLLAQLFALGIATLFSYMAQRWWVFRVGV
jgi:putative flippase GtrA